MALKQPPYKHPPQVIENQATAQVCGRLLERHLTDLQNVKDERAIVELFADTFDALKHSACQEGLFDIIDKVTDIFMVGNDSGKEAKRCLILSITDSCIDVIISPTVILVHKIEILKSFNTLLENCSATTKCELLARTQFKEKLSLLFKSISQVGDYEVQVCISEFIFRLVPKSKRKDYLKSIIDGSDLWAEFLDIRDNNFEIDCRYFLNKLNKQNTCPMTRVYSYPAEFVSIDGNKLYKPSDDGYDDFWVDFNEGSKRIEIFCESNLLSSQQSQNVEQDWETVCIWAQDVKKYSCTVKGMLWMAVIELKPGAEMLSNKEADNLSHLVTIATPKQYDLKRALEDTIKIHHKASSVDVPVCISQKPDVQATISTVLSMDVPPIKPQTFSQQQRDRSVSSIVRSKISVPSEPMISPASSVITSNTEPVITWQEIQERQRQQTEKLAKVVDLSGCKEKDTVFVAEAAVIMKGKEKEDNFNTFNATASRGLENISHPRRNSTGKKGSEIKSNGPSKSSVVIDNVENETGDSHKTGGKRKDASGETTKVNKSGRNRSQAKVKASEKCTDMTWHNMDARASDAHVNVASSPVTEGGDNNFCLQYSQKKHNCGIKSSKCAPKGINEKKTPKNIQEQNEGGKDKNRTSNPKESQDIIFSTNGDNELQATKSLRSRTSSSVTSFERTKLDAETALSNSNPSQLDVIPGTLLVTEHQDYRQLSNRREGQKRQTKKTRATNVCDNENLVATSTSTYEEIKSGSRKNKQKQTNVGNKKSYSKDSSCKLVTSKSKVQNTISPGNISLDDFKPSKSFRSLRSTNRKMAEKSDGTTMMGQTKTNNEKFSHANVSKASCENVSGTGKEDAGIKTLREFLPMLQERRQSALGVERNKKTLEMTAKPSSTHSDAPDISPNVGLVSVDVCSELHTKSKETNLTSKVEEPKELNLANNNNSTNYEVLSSTSSGELFVVVEASKNTEKESDVIMESQFEISPPYSFDAIEVTNGKKQKSVDSPKQSEQLSNKLKLDSKFADAYSRYQSPHLDMQTHSNPKSSYVFSKHTGNKANASNSHHVDCGKSKTDNTQTNLKSPKSQKKIVEINMNCKKKAANSVQKNKNTNHSSLSKGDDKLEKVNEEKTNKTAGAKEISQVKPCSLVQNNHQTTNDRKQGEISSKSVETTVPTRKLRTRNKTVSYKECDSDCVSCDTRIVKNPSQNKSKKSEEIISHNVISDNHTVSVRNDVSEASPTVGMKMTQNDVSLMNELGSQAPKKARISKEPQRQFWTSHRMEKTVTTMSFSKSVYSLSSDPYDFEAECKKRSKETPNLTQFRSSSFMKQNSGNKMCTEIDGVDHKKQSSDKSKVQLSSSSELLKKKETYTKQSSDKSKVQLSSSSELLKKKETYTKQSSDKSKVQLSSSSELLKKKETYTKQSSDKSKVQLSSSSELLKKKETNSVNTLKTKQHLNIPRSLSQHADSKQCNKLSNNTNSSASFAVVKHTVCEKTNNLSFDGDSDVANSDSERGSSRFGLYASQYVADQPDTGIVFPHLEDSIPCTPIQDDNIDDNHDATKRKSIVSDLSWLAQAKKPCKKQEQKRSKTYKRNKSLEEQHLATWEDDLEPGPKYSSLYCKLASKVPSVPNQTPKPINRNSTPGKRKMFSPLDFRTISGKSSLVSKSESREHIIQPKDNRLNKDCQKERSFASDFTKNTPKLDSLLGKKSERNSSFKSPGIIEKTDSEISESVLEDNHQSLNKLTIQKHNSDKSTLSTSDERETTTDSWGAISSKIDQQLQDVIDRLSGNYGVCSSMISGPSSYHRPSRSTLKRKYPSVSSLTDSADGELDTENDLSDHQDCAQQRTFLPRKLFKSDLTPVKHGHGQISSIKKQTGKVIKELTNTPISNQICNKKYRSENKACDSKLCDKKMPDGKKCKTPKPFEKLYEKLTSTPQIRLEVMSDICSPEKTRECAQSLEEQHFNTGIESPFPTLDHSSSSSSLIGFDEKSSSKSDGHTIEAEPQTTLLENLRKELIKSTVPQVSEDAEQTIDTEALDINDTVSEEFNSLKEFLIKRKVKTPFSSDDTEGIAKSSQCITSLWETEQKKRMNAIEKFQSVTQNVFIRMNRDMKEAHENEIKATLLWTQEREKIKKHSVSMDKQLKQLKKAHDALKCELQKAHTEGETSQKHFKAAMKQDIDALQRKLISKCNDHALDVMKKCLQMSLLS